jgi:hypothetical protein
MASFCLLAACSDDPGEDLPRVNLTAPSPSALPALADNVEVVAEKEQALKLFEQAVGKLPDVLSAMESDADEKYSVGGNSAARYVYGPFTFHNNKDLIAGASVTGYIKGSQTGGDYEESVVDSRFEVDLLDGITEGDINVKGRIASAMYIKIRNESVLPDDESPFPSFEISFYYDIDEKSFYALTVTDTANKIGGKFILELTAKGNFIFNFGDMFDGNAPDFSNLDTMAKLKVYDKENNELWSIDMDITKNSDIFNSLMGIE